MRAEHFNFDFLQCASFTTDNDGGISEKTVPYYIFAQAVSGRYTLRTAEGEDTTEPGGALLSAPNVPLHIVHHVEPATGTMQVCFMHFRLLALHAIDPLASLRFPRIIDAGRTAEIGRSVKAIEALRLISNDPRSELAVFVHAAEAVRLFADCGTPVAPAAPLPEWLMHTLQNIRRHPTRNPDLAQLRRTSGRSRALFYRDFTRYVGVPPAEFIRRERMQLAAAFKSAHPEWTVGELAQACGFASEFHFSRLFRARFGCAPGSFRGF